MNNKSLVLPLSIFTLLLFLFLSLSFNVEALSENDDSGLGPLVKRKHRRSLIVTEDGEISAVKISDGSRGPFHLQFITLEPNSLFLPVLLHADMVFYVHTGSGKLSWGDEDETKRVNLKKGDIYRLEAGSVFFVQSNLETEREKLRIYAIFSNTDEDKYEPSIGAYSSISDLVLGFDRKVLQAAFKVPEDVIEAITNGTKPPAIVHAMPTKKTAFWELEARFLKAFLGGRGGSLHSINNKKKKTRAYNILDADPDFKNCNGWSITVTRQELQLLRDSNIGVFMVNLTKGSMMAPHWNPMATEIAIVLHGQGMVRVVCSSNANESECKNMRFRVKEGDVFAVPRFHPMAQMSFNNDSFVFMGFSTTTKRNYPQFLVGKRSVLQVLNKHILAVSFNVTNTTIDQLLAPQTDSIILDCTSCAEVEKSIMEEEIEKEREEEEAREREEEEARKREEEKKREEEEARKREEEEEERKREEEEERKREEEEEEARRREEEEAKKREEEEEEARRREEEEERKREEEEARKREEERKRREEEEEEEEEAEREQEEARRQEEEREERERQEEEEEEEEERRRQEEEKQREQEEREQEETRRQEEEREERERQEEEEEEEEEERRRQEEEKQREQEEREQEETRRQEEEREERERQEEEEERRRQEEEKQREQEEREQEEARRQEEEREERERQQEEERRRQEEEKQREQEEREQEEPRKGEGERESKRQQEQEERKRQEEGGREEAATREQEAARRQEEERERRERQEEEEARKEGESQEQAEKEPE